MPNVRAMNFLGEPPTTTPLFTMFTQILAGE
jgi:hypothetical protein